MQKFDVKAMAIVIGVTWGIYVWFIGLMAMFGWGGAIVDVLSSLYIGYSATTVGSLIGGIWGFLDGVIGGAIFAYLYNMMVSKKK